MALLSTTRERSGALYATSTPADTDTDQGQESKGNPIMALITRIGKRNWIIVGAVLLIGLAVALNWHFLTSEGAADSYPSYNQSAGMIGQGDASAGAQDDDSTDDYFATVELNRRQARDESLEVLQNVIDSEFADETVKAQALAEMAAIADEIDTEANIESLIISKGFDDCIAILNGETINVVVRSEGELQPAQIAQINAVVYEQTGLEPINIVINHRQ
jgi:hypothetical protein